MDYKLNRYLVTYRLYLYQSLTGEPRALVDRAGTLRFVHNIPGGNARPGSPAPVGLDIYELDCNLGFSNVSGVPYREQARRYFFSQVLRLFRSIKVSLVDISLSPIKTVEVDVTAQSQKKVRPTNEIGIQKV
jgi:hypothetical protein